MNMNVQLLDTEGEDREEITESFTDKAFIQA